MKKLALLVCLVMLASYGGFVFAQDTEEIEAPGFFDVTRVGGNAWKEIRKPSSAGEKDGEIKLAEVLAWEVLGGEEQVWTGDVILSELDGVIAGVGVSVSVEALAEKLGSDYRPEAEVLIGLDVGYRPNDKCILAGVYASIRF